MDTPSLDTLTDRLERLERENESLRRATRRARLVAYAAVLLGPLVAVAGGAALQNQTFTLIRGPGTNFTRIQAWGEPGDVGGAGINFFENQGGTIRMALGYFNVENRLYSALRFYDENGQIVREINDGSYPEK